MIGGGIAEHGVGTRKSNVPVQHTKASNFDHDSKILVETAQAGRVDGFVDPTGGITQDGPFRFDLPSLDNTYLMMCNLYLHIKARVVRSNNTLLVQDEEVSTTNLFATAMFDRVEGC